MKRNFILGEEWIYYKIYCGPKTADELLIKVLAQLSRKLCAQDIIDGWFFIRYSDPELHLRIRFHLKTADQVHLLITHFNSAVYPFLNSLQIHNIQTDTYRREIERYGIAEMRLSEQIFYHDSNMIIEALSVLNQNQEIDLKWLFFIKAAETFLTDFRLNMEEKFLLLKQMRDNYAAEFGLNRLIKQQIDKKYRKNSSLISMVIDEGAKDLEFEKLLPLIEHKSHALSPIIDKIISGLDTGADRQEFQGFIASHIHMMNNRLFRSRQRLHELVLYDFLFRYFKSKRAQQNFKTDV
jgi:thiopeptide-type bacteriocin biosynthesis protein